MRFSHFLVLLAPFVMVLIAASSSSSGKTDLSDIATEASTVSSNTSIQEVDGTSNGKAWPLGSTTLECGYISGFLCSLMAVTFSLLGVLNVKDCKESCSHINGSLQDLTMFFAWSGTVIGIFSAARTIIVEEDTRVASFAASAYWALKCIICALASSLFPSDLLEGFKTFFGASAIDVAAILVFAGLIYLLSSPAEQKSSIEDPI